MTGETTTKYIYIVCDQHDPPLVAANYFYGVRSDGTLTQLVGPQGVAKDGGQYMLIDTHPRPQANEANRPRFNRLEKQNRVRSRVVLHCPDPECRVKLDLREENLTPFLRKLSEHGISQVSLRGIQQYAGGNG